MADTKKQELIKQIQNNIDATDVAWYIKEEVKSLLDNFHYYKLKNIDENFDFLQDYLSYLDYKNTKQIKSIKLTSNLWNSDDFNIDYYISQRGKNHIGEDNLDIQNINNSYYLNTIVSGLRGFIVLSIWEFCNASNTRLHINKYFWTKELSQIENYV